jgi:hypothetical protein
MELTSSLNPLQQHIRAIVYGPPGNTKTASSVTLSDACPADWTHQRLTAATLPQRTLVTLDDMLWIGFDSQALLGFKQLGVAAPIFDLSATQTTRLPDELRDVVAQTVERVRTGKTKTVVVDTVSALDELLTLMLRDRGLDGFDLYRELLVQHLRFALSLKELQCNILFLCHAKAAADTVATSNSNSAVTAAATAAKKQAASGTATIIPQITGAALNHYRRDVSLIFSVSRGMQTGPDKRPVDGFWFNARHKEFDAKSRLLLPDVLPADWRVVRQHLGGL